MGILKIASFNIMDNHVNKLSKDDVNSNSIIVSNIIKKFDIVGTQELTFDYINSIKKHLSKYMIFGKYRFGNLLARIPFNETNSIITNKKVSISKTKRLPLITFSDMREIISKKALIPRIITIVIFKNNDDELCMINTHLNNRSNSIKVRQLNYIKKLIFKYEDKYPVILTGDFNMDLDNEDFKKFVSDIKKVVKLVKIEGYSWKSKKGYKKNLDYIFIPVNYKVEESGIISSQNISDHNLIYANIRKDN